MRLVPASLITFFVVVTPLLFGSSASYAGSDFLARQQLRVPSTDPETSLNRTVDDLRGLFQRFRPAVDSGSKILSGPTISGARNRPRVQLTVQKCVLVVCKTVELDADVAIRSVSGACRQNYVLTADLSNSSDTLRSVYSRLQVDICFDSPSREEGQLKLVATAQQGPRYSRDIVQQQVFKLLQLQVAPIVRALDQTLRVNGK